MKRLSLFTLLGTIGTGLVVAGLLALIAPPPEPAKIAMPNMPGMKIKPDNDQHLLPWARVAPLVTHDDTTGTVDKTKKQVTFTGKKIDLVLVAVEPGFPDTTFEVHKLVNPTISVPTGATITLTLVNMDYGPGMIHGIAIGQKVPPYDSALNLPLPHQLASIPLLMPRTKRDVKKSSYWVSTVSFTCKKSGTWYYLCQMPTYARVGMFGKFVVRK